MASHPFFLFSYAIICFSLSMVEGLVFSHLLSSFIFIFVFLGNNDVSGLNCEYLFVDIARHVGLHELEYFFFMTSPMM